MKLKILFILLLMCQLLFCQTDINNIIKGGELVLSGLSVLKINKSYTKKESKVIESVCVKMHSSLVLDMNLIAGLPSIWFITMDQAGVPPLVRY